MEALGADPDIYQKLTASVAPSIWQMDDVKKGILCQLFGGSSKVLLSPPPQLPRSGTGAAAQLGASYGSLVLLCRTATV